METKKIKVARVNGGRYFKVLAAFPIWVDAGSAPSNASYGNARLLRTVYKEKQARPGDQINILPGGDFLVSESGYVFKIKLEKPEFAPFERRYGDFNNAYLPARMVVEISRSYRRHVDVYPL